MKKRLCVIFAIIVLVDGFIEELKLPDTFTECMERQRIKNKGAASYEALKKWCINSHRMKLQGEKLKHTNVSEDTVSWINELLRMSNVDMKLDLHVIHKRQAISNSDPGIPTLYQNIEFPPQPQTSSSNTGSSNSQQVSGFETSFTGSDQAQRFQPGQSRPFPIIGGQPQQNFPTIGQNAVQPILSAQQVQQVSPAQQVPQVQPAQQVSSVQQVPQVQQVQPAQQVSPVQQVPQVQQVQPVQQVLPVQQVPQVQSVPQVQQVNQFQSNPAVQTQFAQTQPQQQNFVQQQQQQSFGQPQQRFQPVRQFQPPAAQAPIAGAVPTTFGVPTTQQTPRLRIRKEYRMLTDQERANFHRAIIMLKQDTTIRPNRYDALGLVHFRMVDNIHHGGAFLAWHRLFITIFENALRQKVPDVTLPYWDSTMDEAMIDPTQSNVWTPAFLGNGNGLVNTGPFAFWQTPNGPLIRNIGQPGGQLLSRRAIMNVLSRTRMAEITEPAAPDLYNIENYHGDAHTWIGGQMEPMETSAFDPVFYMHHAFVDYVYEIFRQQQLAMGIDPTQDYPQNPGPQSHAPFTPTGFGNLPNIFGTSNIFTSQIYTYQPHPTCSFQNANCGSPYLTCDISTGLPLCIPVTAGPQMMSTPPGMMGRPPVPGVMGNGPPMGPVPFGRRKKRAAIKKSKAKQSSRTNKYAEIMIKQTQCQNAWLSFSSQNTFQIDNSADTRKWVFIPVRVVNKRSPEHRSFHAYAIIDGKPSIKSDIYDPEQYSEIKPYFSEELMPSSSRCKSQIGDRTVGRIHIRSDGLNYQGNYDEYVIVDLRQAFTESTTYIGLKSPKDDYSEVMLSAFDSCGRKCQAFCRSRDLKHPGYHKCSGALRVNNKTPWEYGKNYGDAVRMSWDLNDLFNIPELQNNSVFIQFFCDHRE